MSERTSPALNAITCLECGRPWGVILNRAQEPSAGTEQFCQELMWEVWLEGAECDEEGPFDFAKLPKVAPVRVVFITDALADFASEHDLGDAYLGNCWQQLGNCDLPKWLLKGRKQRWAYCWDCCELGWASNYLAESA